MMKPKKLTRREAALVAHARKIAVAEFCELTEITVMVRGYSGPLEIRQYTTTNGGEITEGVIPGKPGPIMRNFTLQQLGSLNVLEGFPQFTINMIPRWREEDGCYWIGRT